MRIHRPTATARFFTALGILAVCLTAMVVVGLDGLSRVDAANRQVFSENLPTAEALDQLATELGVAESVSLQIRSASDRNADRLRAELAEIVIPAVGTDIQSVLDLHAGDTPRQRAESQRIPGLWRMFVALARAQLLNPAPGADRISPAVIAQTIGPAIALVRGRQSVEVVQAASAHAAARATYSRSRTWMLIVAALALIAAATLIRAGLALRLLLRSQARDRSFAESSNEYTGRLQATEDEDEAHELLRRQLERTHPGSHAVVLSRNNSADRLQPRTTLAELEGLTDPLDHAVPRACLAVRFATGHSQGGPQQPLTSCEVCGQLPGRSSCEPLLVGGEVIGSVLVNQPAATDAADASRIRQTVAQAAPVLGNLRNLALAELRAATDLLTGLPNQRAVQDTLKRMVAQASRTSTPLAAVLVDLDHFKEVNDIYGHDRGDEVLAAAGVAFRNVLRDSDFVGRYGGEEFLILLPSTDKAGAVQVAQAIRTVIAAVRVPGIDRPITASCGVAVLPSDAGDTVTLFRAADRALYAAKNDGRDRVCAADGAREAAAGGRGGSGRAGRPGIDDDLPGVEALAQPEVTRERAPHR